MTILIASSLVVALVSTATHASASGLYVITVAGNGGGSYSGDGVPAVASQLNNPKGLALDSSGNVYIADSGNQRIREVSASTGFITTVAGDGETGYSGDGGQATSAELSDPDDVAVSSSGDLYISDSGNNVIRKVDLSTGIITAFAGNGTAGYSGDGGAATSAELSDPTAIALDSSGNLYMADSGNDAIREVDHSTGDISTVAGTGTAGYSGDGAAATSAELSDPDGIALDSSGNIYISDSANNVIRAVDHSTGDISTIAGTGTAGYSGDGGAGTSAELSDPAELGLDSSGNLYIDDIGNGAVRELDVASDGISTFNTFIDMTGLAVDPSGDVFVSRHYPYGPYDNVYEMTTTPPPVSFSSAMLNYGSHYVNTSDSLSVTLTNSGLSSLTISAVTVTGADDGDFSVGSDTCSSSTIAPTDTCSVTVSFTPTVNGPRTASLSIADGASGSPQHVYLYGVGTGYLTTVAGGSGSSGSYSGDGGPATSASLNNVTDVALDSSGNLYIADSGNQRIREVAASTGFITTVAGDGGTGYTGDGGQATSAELSSPDDVAVSSSGDLYISDSGNNVIRKVDLSTGVITTFAGDGTAGYSGDGGSATSAELSDPTALAIDSSGNLYITDNGNNVIRKVDHSTGDISTVAGTGTAGFSGDGGAATSAELSDPDGVAVDSSGNIYISDSANNRIREVDHSTGDISTIVGNGTTSGNSGPAVLTAIDAPGPLALDSAGNLYFIEGSSIEEVNAANGAIDTVWAPTFESPTGLTVDPDGDLFLTMHKSWERGISGQYDNVDELGPTPPPVSFSSTMLNYGSLDVDTSDSMSVTLTNSGLSSLTISGVAVTGADHGDFSIVSDFCSSVTVIPTDTCSVTVDFTPSALGPRTGSLTFTDSAINSPQSVYLYGVGTGYLTTVAGSSGSSGSYSGDGGPATSASLNNVTDVALDSSGNLYIADSGNNVIREVDSATGIITTVAGDGTSGYSGDGGAATGAELSGPTGVAVSSTGSLYIIDSGNNVIRKVDLSTGVITTFAGDGTAGYSGDGGSATSAELSDPTAIALDSSGNLYIADSGNNVIRKVNHSTGDISTVAGTGTAGFSGDGGAATSAELSDPDGVAVDSSGNIYISDSANNRIREVDHSTGDISTIVGNGTTSGNSGPAVLTAIDAPGRLALDSAGNLYFIEGSSIEEVNAANGAIDTLWTPTFESPTGLTVDPDGDLFLTMHKPWERGISGQYDNVDELSPYGGVLSGGPVSGSQRYGCGGGIAPGAGICSGGDPVDIATGDFVKSATDASVPTYGPSLSFTRTYDAFSAQQEAATSTPGPLGYGWTDNWATSLSLNTAYATTVSGDITLNQANGSQAVFVPPVSGSCPTPFVGPGSSSTYCALSRVLGSLTYNSGTSTYTLIEHPEMTYTFNSSGQLTSIADPDGATETLTYDSPSPGSGNCPGGATSCETITSASGRTLTLGWSGSGDTGTITSVTDPIGRRTTYSYSSGNLTTVSDPLGNVTSYSYDSSNGTADLKHDLLTVTDPNGQSGAPDAGDMWTNTYNSAGQVTSQTDQMGRVTSFDYTAMDATTLNGTVVVTDPDANETAYTFNQGTLVKEATGYGTAAASATTYDVDSSTLLDESSTDADNRTTNYTYDNDGNVLTKTNPLGKTWSYSYNSFDEVTCAAEPLAASPCSALSPPSAITAGTATITPPGSAPPKYVTFTEYDTDGNEIYQTTGDYAPGAGSASQSKTTYDLYNGQSVTIDSVDDSCTNSSPSTELPCATIDPDAVVTQLGYNSDGDLTSKSTPDGNAGGELATTTYGYDSDGEQTSRVAPDGNLSGANAANYTTATAYDDDGDVTSLTQGGASGHTVVPRRTTYTYDPNGNRLSSAHNTSPELVGTTSGSNSSSSLALNLPKGTVAGDVVVLSTTTSPASGTESVTTPSGYALLDSKNTGQTTTYVYTHTVSSDTGVTLSYSTSAAKVATLAVFSGVDTASPVDVSDDATTSSGTSVAASALTTTEPGDVLLYVGGAGQQGSAATWSAPSDMTSEVQAQISGVSSIVAKGPGPAAAGSTGSKTATTSVSGQLAAIFLALTPGTVTTTTSYDPDNEATLVTDPDGKATLTCYDGDAKEAETVPAVGVAADSLTASSCPTSYPSDYGDRLATDATTTAYNAQGEKTTVTTPAPAGLSGHETTTYSYDQAGELISATAPPTSNSGGAPDDVTDYTYDAAGELLTTTTGAGTATAATTSSCYDPDGDTTTTVAADGNTSSVAGCSSSSPYDTSSPYQTTYSYDSLGEVVMKTAPDTSAAPSGQVSTYTYDPAGNLVSSENPDGVTATGTYTPLDQLATVSYSDSTHDASYSYDADGNGTAMTDASGISSYSYNPFDQLISAENGASQTVSYTHDALGDTTSITYPLGAGATWANTDTVTYGYDRASELTSVTDFNGNTSVVTNTADGLPSALSLGSSGDTVTTDYAASDGPSSITLGDGSTLQEFAYSDTPSGSIASETETPSSSLSPADYTYDDQGRVTQMTPGTDSAISYGEDASGNLTTLPTGSAGTYDDASELTSSVLSATTTDYTYDASGNRTQESVGGTATVDASYNGASQLTNYENSVANMTTATYDGDGLRTSATTTPVGGSSSTENFVWDTTSSVPHLLMDSDNAYIYGPSGTPFEQVDLSTGTITYLVADALGSVRGIVDSAGSLTASTAYDAWGNPETTGGLSASTPFGFAGGYTDPTGLLYLVHRYYDPATGQFLTVDPDVAATGQPYAYTGDDPVNGTDPLGLFCLLGSNPGGGCRGASEAKSVGRAVASGVKKYDPFYAALKAYDAEYHAEQNGCSLATVFGDASRAVGDVVVGSSVLAVPEAEATEGVVEAGTQAVEASSTDLVPWEQYPDNGGFVGDPVQDTLQPGATISRFGGTGGSYASPEDVPFSQRGLPPEVESGPYGTYQVVQPVDVEGGIAQYWMGGGGGVQYRFLQPIQDLLDQGILKDVG